MENTYIYTDEDAGEELTFRKVGRFFKKGWLRMVVYALIALALAALITVPIKVFYKTEPVVTTAVEFVYDGIEKGENPNGGTFDRDLIISTRVLTAAVNEAKLEEKITEINKLRSNMRVDSVFDEAYYDLVEDAANGNAEAQETLRQTTFYPTRFDIVLSEPAELGLTDNEAVLLVEKVVAAYYDDFADRYSVTKIFPSETFDISNSQSNVEFVDIYDLYIDALSPIEDFVSTLNEKKPSFVSPQNNTTFSLLLSEYGSLNLNFEMFNNYILINNIWKNKPLASDSLTESKKRLENELQSLNAYVDALKTQISNIKPQETTEVLASGPITTTTYPDLYYEYQDKLNASQLQVKTMTDRLDNIGLRIAKIGDTSTPTSDELIASANAMLRILETQAKDFVNKVNATVADYYEQTVVSNAVRQVLPATVSRKGADFNIAVILIVSAVVGLLVGGIVTGVKMSNAKQKSKLAPVHTAAPEKKNEAESNKAPDSKEE